MKNTLADKVAILTGASSGIGTALAKKLGQKGAKLVLAARREDRLIELQKDIINSGGQAFYRVTDVSSKEQVTTLAHFALQQFGRIDVLVNNAGVMSASFLIRNATDEWNSLIDINIKGVLYTIGAVLPHMREQRSGHIINISSNAAHTTVSPYSTVYCMTKHAVRLISDGLRQEEEMAGSNIRVTEIAPGAVDTELVDTVVDPQMREVAKQLFGDKSKLLTADEVADAIIFAMNEPENILLRTIIVQPTKS